MLTEEILQLLHKVKRTGNNRWIACCPAHDDKSPSLSIKDVDDRVLIRCWSGCSSQDIVDSLGLKLRDLFHYEMTDSIRQERRDFHSREKLQHEMLILKIALSDRRRNRLNRADADRANQAYRIMKKEGLA